MWQRCSDVGKQLQGKGKGRRKTVCDAGWFAGEDLDVARHSRRSSRRGRGSEAEVGAEEH
eukprot:1088613-Rhodomonas_salina.1